MVWSEHDDLIGELTDYLDESLDRLKPYVRPLAIVSLPKSRFINLDTGESNAGQAGVLHDAVEKAVSSKPQLAALVAWETDVQAAASATLSALVDLVPENLRNSTSFAENLGQLLTPLGARVRWPVSRGGRSAGGNYICPCPNTRRQDRE